ncbi:MAG: hypothetical protein U5K43_05490 [Halofilum sp. (in: g-proteobacteria)]|nr:hypothetical protein [Halofilum sp. (in: g-proteobacteria)]
MDIDVLRHVALEGLGLPGSLPASRGAAIETVDVPTADVAARESIRPPAAQARAFSYCA